MGTSKFNPGGIPAMDHHPNQRGVEILLVASCYRNWDEPSPDGSLGSYADFTFLPRPEMHTKGFLYIASVRISWLLFNEF